MNALFDEHNNDVVEYSNEAIIPRIIEGHVTLQHESLLTQKMEQAIASIGGSVHGEHIKHTNGESLNHTQFEKLEEKEEINV